MDSTLKSVCRMAQGEEAALRAAALRVLGELRASSAAVTAAVRANLADGNDELKLRALEAAERIGVLEVVEQVLPLLGDPGPVGRKAGETVAAVGQKGLPALLDGLARAPSAETRRALLGVIAGVPGARAEQALIRALGEADAVEADGVARALSVRLGTLRGGSRRALGDAVAALLRTRKRMSAEAVAAGARVLGRVGDPHHRAMLLDYARPQHPAIVRREAMLALAVLPPPTRGGDRLLQTLLRFLDEPDFANVVQPALTAIQRLPTPPGLADQLQRLLEEGSPAVRRVAAEKLGEVDRAPRAKALLRYFDDADAGVQDSVAGALAKMSSAVPALLAALEKAEDVERAWRFVRVLEKQARHVKPPAARRLLAVGTARVEKEHATARPLLHLLRGVNPRSFRDNLLARSRAMLRSRKAPAADALLHLLAREDLESAAARYEYAVVKLAVSRLDVSLSYREGDPALRELTALVREGKGRLSTKLCGERVLGPAHLLYVGFHFVERSGSERQFGAEVLTHVSRRWARTPEGQVAKNKLVAEALDKPLRRAASHARTAARAASKRPTARPRRRK